MEARSLADRIDALLPQTQCMRCGYGACRPYAEAVASGAAKINRCPPGGEQTIAALSQLTGRPAEPLDPGTVLWRVLRKLCRESFCPPVFRKLHRFPRKRGRQTQSEDSAARLYCVGPPWAVSLQRRLRAPQPSQALLPAPGPAPDTPGIEFPYRQTPQRPRTSHGKPDR